MKLKDLEKKVEALEADIAIIKLLIPAPKGFESWKQFDDITQQAIDQLTNESR